MKNTFYKFRYHIFMHLFNRLVHCVYFYYFTLILRLVLLSSIWFDVKSSSFKGFECTSHTTHSQYIV